MTRETSRSLLKWTPISPRILVARFAGRQAKLSVVVCYAPTNVAEVETKEEFYHTLQAVVNNIPKHDIMCVLGDLNAIVGNDESYCPQALGRHGMGVRNENGTMLIDFAMANDLVIGGSLFPHRDVHKYSWTSPGGAVRNQIDHCLVSRKFRSSIQDVRAYRGADVGSDHNLLVTKFSLKLKRNEKKAPNSEPQFDSDKLLDRTTRHVFVTELSNKFEALYISDQDDQETIWDQIKNLYTESASKTLGHRKKPKDQWLSDRTWQLIEERKVAKLQLLACHDANQIYKTENYRRIDKSVKKSARRDKRHFYEAKAAKAEEAAKNGDSRSLYKITNEIIGKKRASDGPVKDENGILVTGPEEKKEVWVNYFDKILNRPPPDEPISIPEDPQISLDINTEPPTEDEILKAVKKLKNGRSPGDDRITAEMLKCSMDTCVTYWKDFFGTIWTTAKVPSDWRHSTLVKLFKKGDATLCNNWRGISLLSVPGKLLSHIILSRIQRHLDEYLRDEQHGFRPNRSCTDLIFTLRMLTEESCEWRNKLYMIFIDFEKAFDSLDRQALWKLLRHYGIPDIIVNLIMAMYEDTTSCVKTAEGNSRKFPILSGVKQGCVLSPLLFAVVIDFVLRSVDSTGLRLNDRLLSDLDFADDIAILETCKSRLQALLTNVQQKAEGFGLNINASKTKGMATSGSPMNIKCGDNDVEQVVHFKYLGSTIENTGSTAKEVIARIGQASSTFNRLKKVWRSSTFSLRLKLRLFNSNVLPVLLYASETWHLNQEQERRIQSFENMCLRRLLGIHWTQRVTNEHIRNITGQPSLIETIRRRRWSYLGHVLRMDDSRIPKSTFFWLPEGTRRRGRPKNTLRRTYNNDLRHLHASIQPEWEDIVAAASFRDDWRLFMDALGASGGTGGSKV